MTAVGVRLVLLAHCPLCGHQVMIRMSDPAPVVGLSPRDPLNGFAGWSAFLSVIAS